jgi:hypothetical protein
MPASLPFDGESAWGDILNTYLTALSNEANSTQTGLNNHAANSPTDPHGDRAFAQTLVAPFTTGLNAPNGLVKLNGSGTVPPALITASSGIGGIYNAVVDAVTMFGVTAGNNVDQSAALQSAMNYVSGLGGGIVYIGPGTFSVASPVYIGSNTWVMLSPGTIIQRIPGSPNASYIFTNIQLTNSSTPASNVKITGGTLNAVGSFTVTTACTLIEFFQGSGHSVSGTNLYTPAGNSHAVEFNGVSGGTVSNCLFNGTSTNSTTTNSCVLINASTSASSPSGLNPTLYNGQYCYGITIESCGVQLPANSYTYSAYGCLLGSDVSNSSAVGAQGITVSGCSFESPALNGPIYQASASWTQALFAGNSWGDGKGTSSSSSVNTSIPYDTWIQCSLNSGWSNAGGYPLQYKISQDGTVTLVGYINVSSSSPTGTITTLAYHPANPVYNFVSYANTTQAFSIQVLTNGHVSFTYAPSGIAGNPAFINFTFPADFSGNGLIP